MFNLRTTPLLRLSPTLHARARRRQRAFALLKHLVFLGLILPLLIAGAVLFLATFGP